jgi:hypothetical protein
MKKHFRYTKLVAAIAVAMGASAVSDEALAVNKSDNGLGDAAFVPYYTVREGTDSYIHLTNTSNQYVIAVKIRWRDAMNSRDARDFDVILSPNDVWTGVVTMDADGQTPILKTVDQSCTAPAIPADGVQFTTIGYAGGSFYLPDGGTTNTLPDGTASPSYVYTIERAQEGHIDIFEMGAADPTDTFTDLNGDDLPNYPAMAVHGSQNCTELENAFYNRGAGIPTIAPLNGSSLATLQYEFSEPLNVLKVAAYMLRVDKGASTGLPVTTLANFFNPGNPNCVPPVPVGQESQACPAAPDQATATTNNLIRIPTVDIPDWTSLFPPVANQITEMGPITDAFPDVPADAVSSLFMSTAVLDEFAIGGAAGAATNWVITFPTKSSYTEAPNYSGLFAGRFVNGVAVPDPFVNFFEKFDANGNLIIDPPSNSCVGVAFNYYDREEQVPGTPPSQNAFSPPPIFAPQGNAICQETQTISFGGEDLLGSQFNYNVPLAPGITNGWMRLVFTDATGFAGVNYAYAGLPVIGFSLKGLQNAGVVEGAVANYAIIEDHSYLRNITPLVVTPVVVQ